MYTELVILGISAIAIVYALLTSYKIIKEPAGSGKMVEIHEYIKEGASAYLKKQYTVIFGIAAIITVLLLLLGWYRMAASYVLGALSSVTAGFVGMKIAVNANVRTTNVAKEKGLNKALRLAFNGGLVMGLMTVGVGLLLIVIQYIVYGETPEAINNIIGYSFGASSVALFARVGGGIYTKAADIGSDLVGKVEVGIPEDDPRNPGVIADNVGDNVGDVAGMGADLFESYVGAIISTMVIASTQLRSFSLSWSSLVLIPLLVAATGIVASILSSFVVRTREGGDPSKPLTLATIVASVLIALISLFGINQLISGELGIRIWVVIVAGLIAGVAIGLTSDYFTNARYSPVKKVAKMSEAGPALTILTGFSYGFLSAFIPAVMISIASLTAFLVLWLPTQEFWLGIYGVALSAVGMLSLTGVVVSADAYGPITDNAAGIAEQAGLGEEVRTITDKLDAAGNTMKSVSKGFAIGSAALTALAFIGAYASILQYYTGADLDSLFQSLTILDARLISGLFMGVVMPALFTSIVILAVSDSAFVLIEEIRRQFREKPGILEFKDKPDYGKAVAIVTSYAIKRLILPGVIAIVTPLIVGFVIGPHGLAGMLLAATISGLLLGLFQGNVGNTWDNAKKYIEAGHHGGKGSEAHKAAVIGDTVGDPMKDAAGPSINILIKLMSIVSLVFAYYVIRYNLYELLVP
ncbi:MAG: sodium-translocating pyrophosphatase [Desulfurococcaceae archaeon TW002]